MITELENVGWIEPIRGQISGATQEYLPVAVWVGCLNLCGVKFLVQPSNFYVMRSVSIHLITRLENVGAIECLNVSAWVA